MASSDASVATERRGRAPDASPQSRVARLHMNAKTGGMFMYVEDYSAGLPVPRDGYRVSELWIIAAFALGGVLLCLLAAIYEPGFAQTLAQT